MHEEVLELVNEKDEVIGDVLKRVANANPQLIHREILVLIYESKEKRDVLFEHRSKNKTVDPLRWDGVAGHVTKGMNTKEAAEMEISEELGLHDLELKYISKELVHYPNETHFCSLFIAPYNHGTITLELEEVEEVKFLNESAVNQMLHSGEQFSPHFLKMTRAFWRGDFDRFLI